MIYLPVMIVVRFAVQQLFVSRNVEYSTLEINSNNQINIMPCTQYERLMGISEAVIFRNL